MGCHGSKPADSGPQAPTELNPSATLLPETGLNSPGKDNVNCVPRDEGDRIPLATSCGRVPTDESDRTPLGKPLGRAPSGDDVTHPLGKENTVPGDEANRAPLGKEVTVPMDEGNRAPLGDLHGNTAATHGNICIDQVKPLACEADVTFDDFEITEASSKSPYTVSVKIAKIECEDTDQHEEEEAKEEEEEEEEHSPKKRRSRANS